MEKRKRSKAEWIRRYVSFVFILFVIAFGTSLSIRANLGSSPISAPPYVLSLVPGMPMTMGQIVICMHVFFILTQILLLRRNYELRQLSQILVSFLFGFYTDESGYIAINHSSELKSLAYDTVAYTGITFFAEYIDMVVKGTIAATA